MTPSNQRWHQYEKDGKYYKTFQEYYWNKQLCYETTYIGRKKNGYMKKWYPDGKLKKHVDYSDDKMSGVFQRWYPNGQMLMSGNYSDGKRIGTWTYWNVYGTVKNEVVYPVE